METTVQDVIVNNQIDITQIEQKLDRVITLLETLSNMIQEYITITLKFYDFLLVVICIVLFFLIVRVVSGIFR